MSGDQSIETERANPNNWLLTSSVVDASGKPFDFTTLRDRDDDEFIPQLTIKLGSGTKGLREDILTVLLFDRELYRATMSGYIPTIREFTDDGRIFSSGQTAPLTYSAATLNQLKDPGYYLTVFRLNKAKDEVFFDALAIILRKLNNNLSHVGITTLPLPTLQS